MKRPFVIDYSISGTLHLSSPNRIAVALRAEKLIREAMADLVDMSVYCEEYIDAPIDAKERYLSQSAPASGTEGRRT